MSSSSKINTADRLGGREVFRDIKIYCSIIKNQEKLRAYE
jgi:hypothetical protein